MYILNQLFDKTLENRLKQSIYLGKSSLQFVRVLCDQLKYQFCMATAICRYYFRKWVNANPLTKKSSRFQ